MKNLIFLTFLLFFSACKTNTFLADVQETSVKIEPSLIAPDASIDSLIAPYKVELDATMNEIIGEVAQSLPKGRPESLLGNWCADAIHQKSEDYYQQPIDFTFVNDGGLRIPALNKGKITLGNMFELMPFDNMLVVLELDYETLMKVFNQIASKGGEHFSSSIRLIIKNQKVKSVTINGVPFQKNKTYKMATTDYLANGGGNLFFLKDKKRANLDKFFRDALIEFVKETTAQKKMINAKLENRVIVE